MRKLRADEIEARVATVSENGCSLLLYIDARAAMRLLDETFGPMNWQREHEVIDGDLYCTISVWDSEKKEWISKQDVGVESYTEKEKGQASDALKRCLVNWGCRELYTAPFIWVSKGDCKLVEKNGKMTTYDHFSVRDIAYDGDRISALEIVNDSLKRTVYTYGKLSASTPKIDKEEQKEEKKYTPNLIPKADDKDKKATIGQLAQLESICKENDVPAMYVAQAYKAADVNELTRVQVYSAINNFEMIKNKYLEEIPFK